MTAITIHEFNSTEIGQGTQDGYFNATAMCKANNKLFADYYRLSSTSEFLGALSADMGIPISKLVRAVKGGNSKLQGTWVHPLIAVNLAQWCSPEFAVFVSKLVFSWMSLGSIQPKVGELPNRLTQVEAEIQSGLTMIEEGRTKVWIAIAKVRSEELWRLGGYKNFEEWCKNRWGWEKSNAHEIAAAGRIVAKLREMGVTEENLPKAVTQVRPLIGLQSSDQFQVWQNVLEMTEGIPTGDAVKTVVQRLHALEEPEIQSAELIELEATIDDCYVWLHRAAAAIKRSDAENAGRWLAAVCTRTLRYRDEFGEMKELES